MQQTPLFGIYEKALPPQSLDRMLAEARACGYDAFELSLDGTEERLARLRWGKRERQALLRAARDEDIQLLTTCLSANKFYPLGSSDAALARRGMDILRDAIDFCGDLGIRVIQVSGFDVYDQEPRTADTQRRYIENLARCTAWAERACVMLAIEPVEGNLLTVRDTMEVVRSIGSCWLQVYPDPANIRSLGVDPVADLDYGRHHIVAVHVRDSVPNVFDATLPLGTGCLDFAAVLRKLKEMAFHGPYVVEMWSADRPDARALISQARTYLETRWSEVTHGNV